MKRLFRRGIPLFCVVFVITLCGCEKKPASEWSVQKVDTAMGTIVTQKIDFGTASETISEEIFTQLAWLEEQLLSWRLETSQVYRVNAARHCQVSDQLQEILKQCLTLSQDSDGYFDVTLGQLTKIWNIDAWAAQEESKQQYELPADFSIEEALQHVGYRKMLLGDGQVQLLDDCQLDLGGIGKGIALDVIRQLLDEKQMPDGQGIFMLGGSVLTYGTKKDGQPWHVAIVDPQNTADYKGYLAIEGTKFVSTSGDYERYVEVAGKRYCHILNPKTGYPADGSIRSVTILADNGLLSDGLSTACFLLGSEEGLRLAEQYQAEALFIDQNGQMVMTDGMRQYFCEKQ